MMKLLIVDRDILTLKSLGIILSREPEMTVLGLVPDCIEALDICAEIEPNMMLIDICSDSVNGINLVKKHYPHIKIVMLVNFDTQLEISKAVELGADGYISKAWKISAIVEKIHEWVCDVC